MQKRAPQSKAQLEKLQARIEQQLATVTRLCETTPTPQYAAAPDQSIMKNLIAEAEDSDFWQNFKKGAPIMFCLSVEEDANLKVMRDMSFIEELLKTKSILTLMDQKIKAGSNEVDVLDYGIATSMMANKLQILQALNFQVEGDGDDKVSFNIYGAGKSIVIDKAKLKEAITIQDTKVTETQAAPGEKRGELESIDTTGIDEEGFLKAAVDKIGDVKKTAKNTLDKETFIRVFKYTGEFAKWKNADLKKQAQNRRCEHFNGDPQQYLAALKENL